MAEQKTWTDDHVSEFHWTKGLPPTEEESPEWFELRDSNFDDYRVIVRDALSGREKHLSLDDLRKLPRASFVAMHTCMQGWSAISAGRACGSKM